MAKFENHEVWTLSLFLCSEGASEESEGTTEESEGTTEESEATTEESEATTALVMVCFIKVLTRYTAKYYLQP